MTNEMMLTLVHSQFQNDDELAHYGILGMHWGIRRYQPYGEGGYDPDHEGKNIGLAARLAGHTGSYSDAIRRGSSFGNRAKAAAKSAAKSFGSKAGKAAKEAYERADYAAERVAQGLISGSEKAKKGLAKYAGGKYDSEAARIYEGASAKDLAKGVFSRFSSDAKTKVSDLKRTSFDDVKSALGSGASRFQETMQRTAMNSKEFARNAAMTASLLGGALDPRSNASQTVKSRSEAASVPDKTLPQRYESPVERGWKNMGFIERAKMHSDALDLAGRLRKNKYETLSKTGSRILGNRSINTENSVLPSYGKHANDVDRSNLGTYSPSDAIRRAGAGVSLIDQKPKKTSKGLSRYSELESLARTSPLEAGRRNATIYDKGTKRGFDRTGEEFNDPEFIDFYRNLKKPWLSQSGRQAARIQQRLGASGDLYAINQTPAARAVSIGGNESTRDIARRLGII